MKNLLIASLFAAAALLTAAAQTPAPAKTGVPTLHLDGDTRACHGKFTLSPTLLQWTSTWGRCTVRSPRLLSHGPSTWDFENTPSKSCPFAVIEIVNITERQQLPATEYPQWEVDGYKTLAGFKQHPDQTVLSCNMQ